MNDKIGTILIVDDNDMNRDMLSRRLERRGHKVAVAENGHRAIEMVRENDYDVILLDIMMPGIDGLEVLEVLRKDFSINELPIIMLTAKSESADVVKALELGANDYVTKPIDFPVVVARLNTQIALKELSENKDLFLRIASHDLKSPLMIILGAASLIPSITPPGEAISEDGYALLARIHGRATEMQSIIEDFLDFQALADGRLQTKLGTLNLNEVASGVLESNADYAAKKKVGLEHDLEEDLASVPADRSRISQVVQNFLGNAIKFGLEGDRIVIKTRSRVGNVLLEVIDSGPGLTKPDLEKAFTKYARMSNAPTGGEKSSGLGLYICKKLIDIHHGEIGVRNNSEAGATFWFSLPTQTGS